MVSIDQHKSIHIPQNRLTRVTFCDSWQAGHSEEWLCAIFSNLTEELEIALRAAWHATMVVHSQCMRQAEESLHNRSRRAMATVLGHATYEVRQQ
jgi:hypothetical protein